MEVGQAAELPLSCFSGGHAQDARWCEGSVLKPLMPPRSKPCRKEHRFSLVVCHPMGCYSTFFLGPEGLVKDLLVPGSIGAFLLQSVWGGQGLRRCKAA